MPLQNRCDPAGGLHVSPARGRFTGNRGIIHDPATRTPSGRRWTTKAWICCALEFRDRKRDVWGLNGLEGGVGWSELFFLDEVTALAAGHRPCFYCRRANALRFQRAWAEETVKAPEMDAVLHGQRWLSQRTPPALISHNVIDRLPNGAMIEADGEFFARRDAYLLPWSFAGYGAPLLLRKFDRPARLVTPSSICRALEHGYLPVWHHSAA